MGRGKDKRYDVTDVMNMSPREREQRGLTGENFRRNARFSGTAVVQGKDGNVKYENADDAGKFGEDSL